MVRNQRHHRVASRIAILPLGHRKELLSLNLIKVQDHLGDRFPAHHSIIIEEAKDMVLVSVLISGKLVPGVLEHVQMVLTVNVQIIEDFPRTERSLVVISMKEGNVLISRNLVPGVMGRVQMVLVANMRIIEDLPRIEENLVIMLLKAPENRVLVLLRNQQLHRFRHGVHHRNQLLVAWNILHLLEMNLRLNQQLRVGE